MIDWLPALVRTLAAGDAAVLLTIVHTVGSTPREAGTTMLVTPGDNQGSIGGGQLEWLATSAADALLEVGGPPRLLRFTLGPTMGQACGGIVWLAAERIDTATLPEWQVRASAVEAGMGLRRRLADTDGASGWTLIDPRLAGSGPDFAHLTTHGEHWRFSQQLGGDPFPVYVFGAGHVGSAVVRALTPLGTQITWVDGRAELFEAAGPQADNVRPLVTDQPATQIATAPQGAYLLVMTHSHALDLELCEAACLREDFAFLGLIGSESKREAISRQLVHRGLHPERLDDLTCPIGIPGIEGKHPAAIAASVAAQILQVRETRMAIGHATHPGPDAPPLSSLPRPQ